MKRFSILCCLVLLLNVLCPVGHVHAEDVTTPTDLCDHVWGDNSKSYVCCTKCGKMCIHEYGYWADGDTCVQGCTICKYVFSTYDHHVAYCDTVGVCYRCGHKDAAMQITHRNDHYESRSNTQHAHVCESCGTDELFGHFFVCYNLGENGHQAQCSSCGHIHTESHFAQCNEDTTKCDGFYCSYTGSNIKIVHSYTSYGKCWRCDEIDPNYETEATATPAPTSTPEVTSTPAITDELEATDAPAVTDKPEATDVPAVTDKPEATDAPAVTDEPKATDAPAVTDEPKATGAPAADNAAEDIHVHAYGVYTPNANGTHSQACDCGNVVTSTCTMVETKLGNMDASSCIHCGYITWKLGAVTDDAQGESLQEDTQEAKVIENAVFELVDEAGESIVTESMSLTVYESAPGVIIQLDAGANVAVKKALTITMLEDSTPVTLDNAVKLSIPMEDDLTGLKLLVVDENGELVEIEYEVIDGVMVFETNILGIFMLVEEI